MGYQRRGDFAADIGRIRNDHGRPDEEVKWNKCSRSSLGFYKALVDYFFKASSLSFHCMVVERAWVKTREHHDGSIDLARRKHFTKFLSNKIVALTRAYPGREIQTRVYVDKIPSSYAKAGEAMEIIGNRMTDQAFGLGAVANEIKRIERITECDSKRYNGIQLCDLLLGAVVDTWNEGSTADHKAELKRHIASYLGWNDLRSDTRPKERKFNIWWLTDQIKPEQRRPIETRTVSLRHPLPPRRIYVPR